MAGQSELWLKAASVLLKSAGNAATKASAEALVQNAVQHGTASSVAGVYRSGMVRELQGCLNRQAKGVFLPAQGSCRGILRSALATGKNRAASLAPTRGFASKGADQAASAAQKQGSNLADALSLQLSAWWERHSTMVYIVSGMASVYLVWRIVSAVAGLFVPTKCGKESYGYLAIAAATVAFGSLYLRRYLSISPDKVYRLAMLKLNTHPGVLEVMGAPLVGSEVRAQVLSGGGLRLKALQPKLRSQRIQMIFPISGPLRKGLVSIEAKKRRGTYILKLLAVDVDPGMQGTLFPPPPPPLPPLTGVPAPTSADGLPPSPVPPAVHAIDGNRIYVAGNLEVYRRGGVLGELRDPFLKVLSMQHQYDIDDEVEDTLAPLALPGADAEGPLAVLATIKAAKDKVAALLGPQAPAGAAAAAPQPPAEAAKPAAKPAAPAAAAAAPSPAAASTPAAASPSSSSSSSWGGLWGKGSSKPAAPAATPAPAAAPAAKPAAPKPAEKAAPKPAAPAAAESKPAAKPAKEDAPSGGFFSRMFGGSKKQ